MVFGCPDGIYEILLIGMMLQVFMPLVIGESAVETKTALRRQLYRI
jgi:hypothetical protein